jgi:hypothetical protein
MAVESTGTNIGYPLLEWVLPDSEGHPTQVKQDGSLATLIAFVCNHCPYVQHIESAFGEMLDIPSRVFEPWPWSVMIWWNTRMTAWKV